MAIESEAPPQISTGIEGLDYILDGGLPRGETYLVYGSPGAGKTTLSLQFALEGARAGERVLYITLAQREIDLRLIARSHGWSLDGVDIHEPSGQRLAEQMRVRQSVLHTAYVEMGEATSDLRRVIEAARPDRVVFDSIGAIRVLAGAEEHLFKQEMTLFLQFMSEQDATAVLLDDVAQQDADSELQTLAHGVLKLTKQSPAYGEVRRQLQVEKMRGLNFHTGWHNFQIQTGGLAVFPRLYRADNTSHSERKTIQSHVQAIDEMLGGGLEAGTACLIVGPTGTGKSSFATLFAHSALCNGEGAAIFLFDEHPESYLVRSEELNMNLRPFVEDGTLHLQSVDTGEITPGEFAGMLRQAVDRGARVVIIDSLTGYYHSMREEALLLTQMHEMLFYMASRGVLGLLIVAVQGLFGGATISPLDVSYMSDSVVFLGNYEDEGTIRRAITVLKKRYGNHEKTIRELRITDHGFEIGDVLPQASGMLIGSPSQSNGQQQRTEQGEEGSGERKE
ncbi:MAG TPA: ATPase domain-containing protein [Rhodothermales bacterium]|nr:ATPase domain-containing protein [Rhodothermales bacterium]